MSWDTNCDDRPVRRTRIVNPVLPARTGSRNGLAFSLWTPPAGTEIAGGVVILHGANSCKESHYDFARAALPLGLAALAFDQRGHGESEGPMDDGAVRDVAGMADELRTAVGLDVPLALRGSSMGGLFAIMAADEARADAVVAICPATPEGLRRGLLAGRFEFSADAEALERLLSSCDLHAVVAGMTMPLLLLHAEGDEVVPVEHSRELAGHFADERSRLIAVPGGHHRSIQHDGELQAVSLRFIAKALREAAGRPQG